MTKSTKGKVEARNIDKKLTADETAQHHKDEQAIEQGLKAFYKVGSALRRIRDNRTYRDKYKTFEGYCRDRWDMGRSYAQEQIRAAGVVDNLDGIPHKPTSVSQCRPLATLEPEQQRVAWEDAIQLAGGLEYVRAKHVQAGVDRLGRKATFDDKWFLDAMEWEIEDAMARRIEMGRALKRIQERGSARLTHKSFKALCEKLSGYEECLRMINAARIADAMKDTGTFNADLIDRPTSNLEIMLVEDLTEQDKKDHDFDLKVLFDPKNNRWRLFIGFGLESIWFEDHWKLEYPSFRHYCQERWGMSLDQAEEYMVNYSTWQNLVCHCEPFREMHGIAEPDAEHIAHRKEIHEARYGTTG